MTAETVSPLEKLESSVQSFMQAMARKPLFDTPENMLAVERRLRESIGPGSGMPLKAVCRSVVALHAKGAVRLSRAEIRALCADLNHSCAACGQSPMASSAAVAQELFGRIKQSFADKYLEIESWHDLMRAYIGAKERTSGCEMLRELLAESFPDVSKTAPYPFPWLPALASNRNVLDKDPCRAVAEQAFKGKAEEIEAIRRTLDIPDASWYWKEVTVSQVALVTRFDDALFIASVPALLQAAHLLPATPRDEVIRQFLERYLKCRELGVQSDLKDFVVTYWGAPVIGAHPKYDLASADVRKMVQEWIVRDDIKDFFTLLQEGGADERRLTFWNRYAKSIEYHRILIGPHAQQAPQPALAQVRGRSSVGKLAGSTATNNALLMKIGNWLVVESVGNESPLFGYRFSQLPFDLAAETFEIPCFRKGGLSDYKALRQDTLEGMWEDKLTPELATLGIKRDETSAAKRKPPPVVDPRTAVAPDTFDNDLFWKLSREGRFKAEDSRPQGGALWVTSDLQDNYYLARKLAGWGFKWKSGSGWWRN